jgi:SAM-dependent methyltransferase
MANVEQTYAWDGDTGKRWATEADRHRRMLEPFAGRIVGALQPQPGEAVLDIGCGAGDVAFAVAAAVAPNGRVVGADVSGPLLAVANRELEQRGLKNVQFVQGDAQVYPFATEPFDAAISRFGVMFFADPAAAFTNIARGLKQDGRVVFNVWRGLEFAEWLSVPLGALLQFVPPPPTPPPGTPGPFSLGDPERFGSHLGAAGLVDIAFDEATESLWLGDSVPDVVQYFHSHDAAKKLLAGASPETVEQAWAAVADALAPHATADGVVLRGGAWIVTARKA